MRLCCSACCMLWDEFCKASVDEFHLEEQMRSAVITHSDITSKAIALTELDSRVRNAANRAAVFGRTLKAHRLTHVSERTSLVN